MKKNFMLNMGMSWAIVVNIAVIMGISGVSFARNGGEAIARYTVYDVVKSSLVDQTSSGSVKQMRVVVVPLAEGKEEYSLIVNAQEEDEAVELVFDVGICEAPRSETSTVQCGHEEQDDQEDHLFQGFSGYELDQVKFSASVSVPVYTAQGLLSLEPTDALGSYSGLTKYHVEMVKEIQLNFKLDQSGILHQLLATRRIVYPVSQL